MSVLAAICSTRTDVELEDVELKDDATPEPVGDNEVGPRELRARAAVCSASSHVVRPYGTVPCRTATSPAR